MISLVFFFNDTATTEIYTYRHTLSRPYALPSSGRDGATFRRPRTGQAGLGRELDQCTDGPHRRRRRRDAAEHDRGEDPRPAAGPSPRQGRPLQPDSRLTPRNKTMAEAYIIDAVRTPPGTGKHGQGALSQLHPPHLAATSPAAIPDRNNLDPKTVNDHISSPSNQQNVVEGS